MKVTKLISVALVTLTVGGTGVLSAPAVTAQAKSTMKVFPKSIRGTWYHYDGKGHYGTTKITAKKIKERSYSSGHWYTYTTPLHHRKTTADPDKASRHLKWGVAIKVSGWTDLRGWNQSAGDGAYYKVGHQRYHGKHVRVLKEAGGAMIEVNKHSYKTKHLAKHFQRSSEIY